MRNKAARELKKEPWAPRELSELLGPGRCGATRSERVDSMFGKRRRSWRALMLTVFGLTALGLVAPSAAHPGRSGVASSTRVWLR